MTSIWAIFLLFCTDTHYEPMSQICLKGHDMNPGTLDISEARKEFSRLDERLRDEHVIWITRHNKKAFAVVDIGLLEALMETVEILNDPDTLNMLQASLDDIRAGRIHDHEDIRSELLDGDSSNDHMDKHRKKATKTTSKKSKSRTRN